MSTLFPDTPEATEEVFLKLLRQTPTWRRMQILAGLNAAARTLALCGLTRRFPTASPEELRRRLADLLLGPDLALRVYGPHVPKDF